MTFAAKGRISRSTQSCRIPQTLLPHPRSPRHRRPALPARQQKGQLRLSFLPYSGLPALESGPEPARTWPPASAGLGRPSASVGFVRPDIAEPTFSRHKNSPETTFPVGTSRRTHPYARVCCASSCSRAGHARERDGAGVHSRLLPARWPYPFSRGVYPDLSGMRLDVRKFPDWRYRYIRDRAGLTVWIGPYALYWWR